MTALYAGWTRPRWSGRVLIARDPGGTERSIGEVEGPTSGPGPKQATLVHPTTGEELWTARVRSVPEGRTACHARYQDAGGSVRPEGVAPDSVVARVVRVVGRHLEGIAAGAVARELDADPGSTGKALQRAAAGGLIRATGSNAGRRYRPTGGGMRPDPDGSGSPGLPSLGGEPAAAGARDGRLTPSSAGDDLAGHAPAEGSADTRAARERPAEDGPGGPVATIGALPDPSAELARLRWELGEAEGLLLLVDRLILAYAVHLRGEGRAVQIAYVSGVLEALVRGLR